MFGRAQCIPIDRKIDYDPPTIYDSMTLSLYSLSSRRKRVHALSSFLWRLAGLLNSTRKVCKDTWPTQFLFPNSATCRHWASKEEKVETSAVAWANEHEPHVTGNEVCEVKRRRKLGRTSYLGACNNHKLWQFTKHDPSLVTRRR